MINVHLLGATVRLEDGSLAAVGATDVAADRPALLRAMQTREPLPFAVVPAGRRARALPLRGGAAPAVAVAVEQAPEPGPREAMLRLVDPAFEDHLAAYLKSTEEWAPADRPPPAERHFIRKKRRAAAFEARSKPT